MTPVLIVEDEAVMAQTIGRWLSALGYPLTYATNAQAAVEAMNAAPAGAAIVDVGLPGGHDGLWLVDQLRRDHPATAVVLATGQDYLPGAATMREGVVSYLLKPFSPDQLRRAAAAAVSWHENASAVPRVGMPSLHFRSGGMRNSTMLSR